MAGNFGKVIRTKGEWSGGYCKIVLICRHQSAVNLVVNSPWRHLADANGKGKLGCASEKLKTSLGFSLTLY